MPKANFFGENGNGFFMNVDMPKLTKNRVLVKVIYKILVFIVICDFRHLFFCFKYIFWLSIISFWGLNIITFVSVF